MGCSPQSRRVLARLLVKGIIIMRVFGYLEDTKAGSTEFRKVFRGIAI